MTDAQTANALAALARQRKERLARDNAVAKLLIGLREASYNRAAVPVTELAAMVKAYDAATERQAVEDVSLADYLDARASEEATGSRDYGRGYMHAVRVAREAET